MIEVKTHKCELKFTNAHVDKDLAEVRTNLASRLQKNPVRIPGTSEFTAACFTYYLGRVPDALELLDASCYCVGAMWAAISGKPNSMVSFPFRDQELQGPSGEPGFGSSPGSWIGGLLLSIARRQAGVIEILEDVPLARLKDFPGDQDECFFHWVAALKLFLAGEDFQPELTRADELSQPDKLQIATPAIVARFRAMGSVLTAIASKNQADLDQGLKSCLEGHKKIYGRGQEAKSPDGLIDRNTAGLAVLAQDRGMSIGVRSGYIPEWLIYPGAAT